MCVLCGQLVIGHCQDCGQCPESDCPSWCPGEDVPEYRPDNLPGWPLTWSFAEWPAHVVAVATYRADGIGVVFHESQLLN